jgi:energy-converting hydrogenase Eha subunit B
VAAHVRRLTPRIPLPPTRRKGDALSIRTISADPSDGGGAAGRFVRVATIALVYLIAMGLFFRAPILSGFDLGFGERGDAIIEIAILEHWRNVLAGAAAWDTTFYFHPYRGTLGYNDGYLLYGLVYSGWRLIADPFHADTLDILTFKTIGFFAAYRLVARTLRWGGAAGLLVALLWTIASNISLQAVHAQLQTVALLPVAMVLAIATVHAAGDGRRGRARGLAMALAALMAAWLLTAYYMAWFTIFSAALFVACWSLVTGNWRPARLRAMLRDHGGTIACGIAAFGAAVVPFLALYLPKVRETGGESYYEMLGYLVTPLIDMVNVGPGNYLWGWLFRPLFALVHAVLPDDPALPGRVLGGEHEAGLPPIQFVLVVVAGWRIAVRGRIGDDRPASPEWRAFALAMLVAWARTLQFWVASPWGIVFEVVPGARGMRVVSRYQLWLVLPFLLLVGATWRERARQVARRRPWLAAGLVTLLVAENLGTESPARLSRADQRAALWTIPPPPRGCASFYVVATRRSEPLYVNAELDGWYPHNVDAMLLAERWRIPTINGFSTFNPPDWAFATPRAADYDARVIAYARRHALHDLCRLDGRRAPMWRRTPV